MRRRTLIATGFILIALVAVGLPSTSHAAFDAYEMVGKALGLSKDQPQGGLGSAARARKAPEGRLRPDTASKFLSQLPGLVTKTGGEDAGKLLSSVLK